MPTANEKRASSAQARVKAALTRDIDRSGAQPVNGNCYTAPDSSNFGKCTLLQFFGFSGYLVDK